jgi:lactam utilization protein B
MARVIDLNADVGEASDDSTMRALCEEPVAREVAIGAHVRYRDREGFGRRDFDVASAAVEAETVEQISALEPHVAPSDHSTVTGKIHIVNG